MGGNERDRIERKLSRVFSNEVEKIGIKERELGGDLST
jgi:hypothetical protein